MDMIVPNDLAVLEYIENPAAEQKDFSTVIQYLLEKYGSLGNAYEAWKLNAADLNEPDYEEPPFEFFLLIVESADATKH